ncbi:MAG: hypothetical protein AAGB19_20080 [Cyanobacteria bacterium P01_F01_bin.3]
MSDPSGILGGLTMYRYSYMDTWGWNILTMLIIAVVLGAIILINGFVTMNIDEDFDERERF